MAAPFRWVFWSAKSFVPPDFVEKITHLDNSLSQEISSYPAILAYATLQLPDLTNFANLVVFSQPEGLGKLKESRSHFSASQHISPKYYDSVRIHWGKLEEGINSAFTLANTNFYTFDSGQTVLANRTVY